MPGDLSDRGERRGVWVPGALRFAHRERKGNDDSERQH